MKGSAVTIGASLAGCVGSDASTDDDDFSDFPRRDISVLHHGSVGGGNETYSRMMARYLPDYLPGDGNAVVIRVRAGGGRISAEQFYNATPDGYTIGFLNEDVIPVTLVEDVDFDPARMNIFGNYSVDINSIWVGEWTGLHEEDRPVEAFADQMADGGLTGAVNSRTGAMLVLVLGAITGWYSPQTVFDNLVLFDSDEEGIRLIGEGDIHYAPGSWPSQARYSVDDGGPLQPLLIGTTGDMPDDPRLEGGKTLATALDGDGVPDGQSVMDLSIDGRTFAGPPGMHEDLVQMYRDAMQSIAEDEQFLSDMEAAGRPVDFVDGETMQASIENRVETWQQFPDLLEEFWG